MCTPVCQRSVYQRFKTKRNTFVGKLSSLPRLTNFLSTPLSNAVYILLPMAYIHMQSTLLQTQVHRFYFRFRFILQISSSFEKRSCALIFHEKLCIILVSTFSPRFHPFVHQVPVSSLKEIKISISSRESRTQP